MKKINLSDCAHCALRRENRICLTPSGKASKGCPTASGKKETAEANAVYKIPEVKKFARQASIQEGQCYAESDKKRYVMHPTKPRIQEIYEFAKKMNYRRLGLIFCVGLAKEAKMVSDILSNQGFDVVSVVCKVGTVPKEEIGVKEEEKIFIGQHETMCNPIAQALIVNRQKTQFNILLGLCVGHDSLFFKYAKAPTTVLAVKDRVTGHNPLAAVYTSGSYYAWINKPENK
ncbi:MAG TPA: DUF1847 domain-containing protein [Smithellaceae bacterium]|jgi:uncharacterized metal-binding protein|nr:DUF1847 domain-containing protein [Smithellaceae bacterium]HOM68957.1 DUF1847 domain-containing protein [Smithellaceae bacterium]HOS08977.1 DUF1847 domain-containing protein [Smithellaceae bacterium]HOU05314.1 DUF1847 domain-containing protein [Smithellaceae bacterium]HOZ62177.1 DUF1847 domain-containing protein [Smithellaceae bacterium]